MHVRRYFASELSQGGREQLVMEGSSGSFFFFSLDSPGRAVQTHTRRSRCARTCTIISAQPAEEQSDTEF